MSGCTLNGWESVRKFVEGSTVISESLIQEDYLEALGEYCDRDINQTYLVLVMDIRNHVDQIRILCIYLTLLIGAVNPVKTRINMFASQCF